MKTGLKYLAIHLDLRDYIEELEESECKRMLLHLIDLSETGHEQDISDLHEAVTRVTYKTIAANVRFAIQKKAEDGRAETSAENGAKGGRPQKNEPLSPYSFLCSDGVYYLTQKKFESLKAEYANKNIDFAGELSLFSAYLEENPDQRGERKCFLQYLTRRLNKARTEQEKQRANESNAKSNPALNYAQRTYTEKDFEHGFFENLGNQPEDQPTDNMTNEPTDSTGQAQQGSESLRTLPEQEAAQDAGR